jgi:hypothetical protein
MSYNSNQYFIVYNILRFKDSIDSFDNLDINFFELYSLLLNSKHLVTLEFHNSFDDNLRELRVIWWNEDAYNLWALEHYERYSAIVSKFLDTVNRNNEIVVFERYTSNDEYVSQFSYTTYPYKNDLIDWVCIPYYLDYLVHHIIPLGKITKYIGNGQFSGPDDFKGEGARFVKERISSIVRREPSAKATQDKNFPVGILAYSIDQSILPTMYETPWLYRKLKKLIVDVEKLASDYIIDCDNAAVLIGHNSLGEELTLHTHRVTDEQRYTLTIAVRLSFLDEGVKFKFYDPLAMDDQDLGKYYANTKMLYDLLGDKEPHSIELKERTSIMVFPASVVPHSVDYNNDLYFYFVYDNVNFKSDKLAEIKQKSQISFFQELPEDSRLYFFNYQ